MDASAVVNEAIKCLETGVHNEDSRIFRQSSAAAVSDFVQVLEAEREERDALCDFRRVERLLTALQPLAQHLQPCFRPDNQSDRYLWGPIKLMLEITNDDDTILDALLDAYARLASVLPALDLTIHDGRATQLLFAQCFADVLEYHLEVYKILRRAGWQLLFSSSWKAVEPILASVITKITRTAALMLPNPDTSLPTRSSVKVSDHGKAHLGDNIFHVQNANFVRAEDMTAIQLFRDALLVDLKTKQKEIKDHRLRECLTWLALQNEDQEQAALLSHYRDEREQATCDWVLSRPQFRAWLDPDSPKQFLWLIGKPGAGKTTLATYIIEHAPISPDSIMLYYLCSPNNNPAYYDSSTAVLSLIVAQVLRRKSDLVPFVYETCVKLAEQPALKLPTLVHQLLGCLSASFLVIDGFNELSAESRKKLFTRLDRLVSLNSRTGNSGPNVRILLTSQDTRSTPPKIIRQPTISLTDEHASLSQDIRHYTLQRMAHLEADHQPRDVDQMISEVVAKADGMFLWVKLVVDTILEQGSLFEMRQTLNALPSGLAGIYDVLLSRMQTRADYKQKMRIQMTFYWLALARRPLKTWEICDALVIGGDGLALVEHDTVLHQRALDICKPLIEIHKDNTVSFVHFSVKDYLLGRESGPFIQIPEAHTHLARTCLRYFLTCEDFFLGRESASTYRQIVLRLHNLFPYAAGIWEDSLYAIGTTVPGQPETAVTTALRLLREDLSQSSAEQQPSIPSASPSQEHYAPPNDRHKLIRSHSGQILRVLIEHLDATPLNKPRTEECAVTNMKDPVKDSLMRFQEQLERLIRRECPYTIQELGIEDDDYQEFLKLHSTASYLCRFARCQRAIKGFSNANERNRHEDEHMQRFRCPELGCDFHLAGFPTRAGLRNHVTRYHTTQTEMTLSTLIVQQSEIPPMILSTRNPTPIPQDSHSIDWAVPAKFDLADAPWNVQFSPSSSEGSAATLDASAFFLENNELRIPFSQMSSSYHIRKSAMAEAEGAPVQATDTEADSKFPESRQFELEYSRLEHDGVFEDTDWSFFFDTPGHEDLAFKFDGNSIF